MSGRQSRLVTKELAKLTSVAFLLAPVWGLNAVAQAVKFGSVSVGSPSVTKPISFTFPEAAMFNFDRPVAVLTQGAPNLDFQIVPSQTNCNGLSTTTGCTVAVSFVPVASGWRNGAIIIYDADNTPIATKFIAGVGLGAQVAFDPGVSTVWNDPALQLQNGGSLASRSTERPMFTSQVW